jgi:hypothetical protein
VEWKSVGAKSQLLRSLLISPEVSTMASENQATETTEEVFMDSIQGLSTGKAIATLEKVEIGSTMGNVFSGTALDKMEGLGDALAEIAQVQDDAVENVVNTTNTTAIGEDGDDDMKVVSAEEKVADAVDSEHEPILEIIDDVVSDGEAAAAAASVNGGLPDEVAPVVIEDDTLLSDVENSIYSAMDKMDMLPNEDTKVELLDTTAATIEIESELDETPDEETTASDIVASAETEVVEDVKDATESLAETAGSWTETFAKETLESLEENVAGGSSILMAGSAILDLGSDAVLELETEQAAAASKAETPVDTASVDETKEPDENEPPGGMVSGLE